jgi:hypothetical protein
MTLASRVAAQDDAGCEIGGLDGPGHQADKQRTRNRRLGISLRIRITQVDHGWVAEASGIRGFKVSPTLGKTPEAAGKKLVEAVVFGWKNLQEDRKESARNRWLEWMSRTGEGP